MNIGQNFILKCSCTIMQCSLIMK